MFYSLSKVELSKDELKALIDEGQRSLEGLSLGDEDEDEVGAVAMRTEGASTKEEDEEWEDVDEGAKGKDEVEEFYKLDDYDTQPDSKKRAEITT